MFLLEADTSKAVTAMKTFKTVFAVRDGDACRAKLGVVCAVAGGRTLVDELTLLPPGIEVHASFAGQRQALTVPAILNVLTIETLICIFTVVETITGAILRSLANRCRKWML